MNSIRMEGRIKFFNTEKGFGFIRNPLEGEKDIFVHITEIPQGTELNPGDLVAFGTTQTRKGIVATGIELLKRADPKQQQRRPEREAAAI